MKSEADTYLRQAIDYLDLAKDHAERALSALQPQDQRSEQPDNSAALSLALTFGYQACEKGWNIQRTAVEFRKNVALPQERANNSASAEICEMLAMEIMAWLNADTGMLEHCNFDQRKKVREGILRVITRKLRT